MLETDLDFKHWTIVFILSLHIFTIPAVPLDLANIRRWNHDWKKTGFCPLTVFWRGKYVGCATCWSDADLYLAQTCQSSHTRKQERGLGWARVQNLLNIRWKELLHARHACKIGATDIRDLPHISLYSRPKIQSSNLRGKKPGLSMWSTAKTISQKVFWHTNFLRWRCLAGRPCVCGGTINQ